MKRTSAAMAAAAATLVLFGALEELLPRPFGTGFPLLLTAALWRSVRRAPAEALLFAAAAGAMEDALSCLPFAAGSAFFAMSAALARRFGLGALLVPPAWCLFQLWLWIWSGGAMGNIFSRILGGIPAGAAALAAVPFLRWLDGKAALDEA